MDETGKFGEESAEKYLCENGYLILERNFRSRFGEIDIIAKDFSQVVFVEVKTRTQEKFGVALEAITHHKLRKLIKTAQFYILKHKISDYRFDAIEVFFGGGGPVFNHVKNITF